MADPIVETTLHPDDSVLVSSLSVEWPGAPSPDPLLRVEKAVVAGTEPRTEYTYGRSATDVRKVVLSVPHGELPLKVVVSDNGALTTLQLQDRTVKPELDRPQVWYTYGVEGSGPTVRVIRFL